MDGMDGMGAMGGAMWMWMLLWGLVGLALLVASVLAIVWLVRRSQRELLDSHMHESAQEVLGRRYAAGQIDEDEYLRRRAGLDN